MPSFTPKQLADFRKANADQWEREVARLAKHGATPALRADAARTLARVRLTRSQSKSQAQSQPRPKSLAPSPEVVRATIAAVNADPRIIAADARREAAARREADARKLDVAMGLACNDNAPRLVGTRLVFGGSTDGAPVAPPPSNPKLDAAMGICRWTPGFLP